MNTINIIKNVSRKGKARKRIATAALGGAALLLAALSLVFGRTIYSLSEIARVLGGEDIRGATFAIMTLRLPRMLTGVLSGASLAVAGSVFQTMLRNTLASPDVIGVSSGSTVAAVFCLLTLRWSGGAASIAAIIAGLAVAALIFALSGGVSLGGGKLILIGIGIGAMLNAALSYMMIKASQYDIPAAMRWLSGSLNGSQMKALPPLALAVATLCPIIAALSAKLRMLELGDDAATALGVNVKRTQLILTLCAAALVAFATSVSGPIAFVSFLSGPIAARLIGAGRAGVLPSALTGIALVLGADLLGQYAFDTRFPVGLITGILGAPYLIFLLIKSNRKGGSI
jgi:iron complex transport system permease protein